MLVDLVKSAAEISGILTYGKGVRIRRDPYVLQKLLNIAGKTAAVTGDDEADALSVSHISDNRCLAHHDDVRVAQTLCNILCKVEAVAAAGIAEYNVFAHSIYSLLNYLHSGIVSQNDL